MHLRFEANQPHQEKAVEAVVDLFRGLPGGAATAPPDDSLSSPGIVPNRLRMDGATLLGNLRGVQGRQRLEVDQGLHHLDLAGGGSRAAPTGDVPNFSLEMETGTGKTYVYVRASLELAKQYGLRKFIIVVPSVAIREGVLKTLEIAQEHFRGLFRGHFNNLPYHYAVYDGGRLDRVRAFAESGEVEFLVMTLDSFNKDANIIYSDSYKIGGEIPLGLIRATRPVLILDEPQNMESDKSRDALGALDPLFILRFSATLRNTYNLIYRLTSFEAYKARLVKQIEVAAVEEGVDARQPYVELVDVVPDKDGGKPRARLKAYKLNRKSGDIELKPITVALGDDLRIKTAHADYAGYQVSNISMRKGEVPSIEFAGVGVRVLRGASIGQDKRAVFREQIRQTIKAHFERQGQFDADPALGGIKVLSLFFIDRVANYRTPTGDDGMLVEIFDDCFRALRDETDADKNPRYPWAIGREPDEVRGAYFAAAPKTKQQRKELPGVELFADSDFEHPTARDKDMFHLIMSDKERLLSMDEPVCFLFSHSALREGWDNPNVFQICTLNTTRSEDRKRQELGRGLRLCVNQAGERVRDAEGADGSEVNVLTIVPNDNYERYVDRYQQEIAEEEGDDTARALVTGGQARRKREKEKIRLRPDKLQDDDFKGLWARLRRRTRYEISLDSKALIDSVVAGLKESTEDPSAPSLEVITARVVVKDIEDERRGSQAPPGGEQEADGKHAFAPSVTDSTREAIAYDTSGPLPNLPQMIGDILAGQERPLHLTRETITRIVRDAPSDKAEVALANPHAWAAWVAREILRQVMSQLGAGAGSRVRYVLRDDGESYDEGRFKDFEALEPAPGDQKRSIVSGADVGDASLYESVVCDSGEERRFVTEALKGRRVRLFLKLPPWFEIDTPVGKYNPDWAVVAQPADREPPKVYFVRETKSSEDLSTTVLPTAKLKTEFGKKHFAVAAPDLHYAVTTGRDLKLKDKMSLPLGRPDGDAAYQSSAQMAVATPSASSRPGASFYKLYHCMG